MFLKSLFTIVFCILCIPSYCKDTYWTPETLPMVHLQDARRYVINPESILRRTTVDSLDRELALLEKETGTQSVVIVIGHIKGDDPYSFGQALADKYHIGHKGRDDGLLVLLCTQDRSYSILVGDGLEGVLPDVVCHQIEQHVMKPLLKQSDWDKALLATINTLDRCIRQDPTMNSYIETDDDDWIGGVVLGILFIVAIIVVTLLSRRKCPRCGKRKLKAIRKQSLVVNGIRKQRTFYCCEKCGHTSHYDQNEMSSTDSQPMFWGSFGNSGTHGGSFGGGHFGGGGASGRF